MPEVEPKPSCISEISNKKHSLSSVEIDCAAQSADKPFFFYWVLLMRLNRSPECGQGEPCAPSVH